MGGQGNFFTSQELSILIRGPVLSGLRAQGGGIGDLDNQATSLAQLAAQASLGGSLGGSLSRSPPIRPAPVPTPMSFQGSQQPSLPISGTTRHLTLCWFCNSGFRSYLAARFTRSVALLDICKVLCFIYASLMFCAAESNEAEHARYHPHLSPPAPPAGPQAVPFGHAPEPAGDGLALLPGWSMVRVVERDPEGRDRWQQCYQSRSGIRVIISIQILEGLRKAKDSGNSVQLPIIWGQNRASNLSDCSSDLLVMWGMVAAVSD